MYSARYETMVHNRSAKKSIISRDGKIQLTLASVMLRRGKWLVSSCSLQDKYKQMTRCNGLNTVDTFRYTNTTCSLVDSGQLQWSKTA